jgi:hypothetical protein
MDTLHNVASDMRVLLKELKAQRDETPSSIIISQDYLEEEGVIDNLHALRNQMLDSFIESIEDIYEDRIAGKN